MEVKDKLRIRKNECKQIKMTLKPGGELNSGNKYEDELKAFDDSKLGVKGLLSIGLSEIPPIFHVNHQIQPFSDSKFNIPIIDFESIDTDRYKLVEKIRDSCENWGFFQLVNHGVPVRVMDEMMDAVRGFHEEDDEVKRKFYSRDVNRRFTYNSSFDLYQAQRGNWRDSFYCVMAPGPLDPMELPQVCRDILIEYSKYISKLGLILFELLSEALGLNPNHLKDMECANGLFLLGHYYPACPKPDLTIGFSSHTDSGFLAIVQQDQIGGLQVLHQNHWVDVPYRPGSLIVNIGDLLQLITNDKFKSVNHRVVAKNVGPRISVASLFRLHFPKESKLRLYGPIKELLSDENPPIYRETTSEEFVAQRYIKGLDDIDTTLLSSFKLQK